jgi:glycosyltransferase involved in cell wall biosynthesis
MSNKLLSAVTDLDSVCTWNNPEIKKKIGRLSLLFVSNFFPPLNSGGYPQFCWDITQALRLRGHRVAVVTSKPNKRGDSKRNELSGEPASEEVYRILHLESDLDYYRPFDFFLNWKQRREENLSAFREILDELRPDVILIWGLWGLSKSLPALAEILMPDQTAYYLAGYWPVKEDLHSVYWRTPARQAVTRGIKRVGYFFARQLLKSEDQTKLKFTNTMCVSNALRESLIKKGLPLEKAKIVYNGIDTNQFEWSGRPVGWRDRGNPLSLLYAGQLAYHKGVHTAIEAIDILVNQAEVRNIRLAILGNGHPGYENFLRQMVSDRKLSEYIDFRDWVPRDQMPGVLLEFDALVLTSIYEEPLARIAQEAMAAGLVVIATPTGGTKELVRDGENGLTYPPGDPQGLAEKIEILCGDDELAEELRTVGRRTIVERFNIERTVDEVETFLIELASSAEQEQVTGIL